MSETRKAKVAKRKAERERKPAIKAEMRPEPTPAVKAEGVKVAGVPAVKAQGERVTGTPAVKAVGVKEPVPAMKAQGVREAVPATHPEMVKDGVPATHPAMVKEAVVATHPAMVADYELPKVNPIIGNAVADGTAPVAKEVVNKTPVPATHPAMEKDEEAPRVKTPATKAAMEVGEPVDINTPLEKVTAPTISPYATQQKQTGAPDTNSEKARMSAVDAVIKKHQEESKPKTLAELLEGQKKKAEIEKTNAATMQKYYALTDALKALGQMGGTAVGGAIGGGAMDSAPVVEAYQPHRGYVQAFEQAKQASDRLRDLDDKTFQLAAREEERANNAKLKKEEMEYKAKMDALDKQWQKDFFDYKAKIEQAAAQDNLKLKAQLEAEQAALEQKYWQDRSAATFAYDKQLKQMGLDSNQWQANTYNTEYLAFNDGTTLSVPEALYEGLKKFYIGKTIGGQIISDKTFDDFVRRNPKLVNDFMTMFGKGGATTAAPATQTTATPSTITESEAKEAKKNKWRK